MAVEGSNQGAEEVHEGESAKEAKESLSAWKRCARERSTELQLLIPDAARKRIIVIPKGDKWTLPQCFGEHMGSSNAPNMLSEAKRKLGFDMEITILRWIWTREKDVDEISVIRSVIIFETHEDATELPQGWEWVDIEEADIFHCDDEGRQAIRKELNSMLQGSEPNFRVAWGRVGWFSETAEWMCSVLRRHGMEITGPVVQLKATILCSILRVNTDRGYYFLKCSPVFCNEAAIISVLCKAAPLYVAEPLFIDRERRMTISADHGEEFSFFGKNRVEANDRPQCFRDLARLQKASMSVIPEMEAAGLQVLSTEWMEENLDFLLEHRELDFMKDSEVLKNLKRSKLYIIQALREVRNAKLPTTIVHGDLETGNMYRQSGTSGEFLFFDWNQSFVGCSFFDLVKLFSPAWMSAYIEEFGELVTDYASVKDAVSMLESLARAFRTLDEVSHVEEQAKPNCQEFLKWQLRFVHRRVQWAEEKASKQPG